MLEWLERWGENEKAVCDIAPDLYGKFGVKRGLRNDDGSGVLVGLTTISSVVGYTMTDGELQPVDGVLRYRGLDVRELCAGIMGEGRHGFEEVSHLLLLGHLPDRDDLKGFHHLLAQRRGLPEGFFERMISSLPSRDVMNALARTVLALYAIDPKPDGVSFKKMLRQSVELIAKFPIMIAANYHVQQHVYEGKPLFQPEPADGKLTHAENFLKMMRPDGRYSKLEADTLDLALMLHAEHGGGNNSSFTVHVITSTGSDTYSAISAAIGSLKGPKHGGANLSVKMMFQNIMKGVKDWTDEDEVAAYVTKIVQGKVGDRSGLVYGMGHAVYTKSDPRTIILRGKARELARAKGRKDELALMETVERVTPEIFYRVRKSKKVIPANVDFYSGFVYDCLDIPQELYTPLFAMARVSGWCAHRIEELLCGGRIIRPAYKAVAPSQAYVPLKKR
ncbi:MAG: citrate synthase [Candidatus Methylomirabilis sp.]|nr:citrate synthase [Deltaproteobacteria bacterium]